MADINGASEDISFVEETAATKAQKLQLRKNYRKIIQETRDGKEELLKHDNNDLMMKIEEVDELFKNVKETREGVLDSKFMTLAVTIGTQKTNLLQTDLVAFQPDEFIQKLITFMDGTVELDNPESVHIPDHGWEKLGKTAMQYFNPISPALHPLLGAFDNSTKVPKTPDNEKRDVNQRKETSNPTTLTTYENDGKEATPQEIERVLNTIKVLYDQDPTPIDYFELVINPQSFGHTIENIFHLAFLVKDGFVKIFLSEHGIPVVEPTMNSANRTLAKESSSHSLSQTNSNSQFMVSLSIEEYEEILDAYELRGESPLIAEISPERDAT